MSKGEKTRNQLYEHLANKMWIRVIGMNETMLEHFAVKSHFGIENTMELYKKKSFRERFFDSKRTSHTFCLI